MPKITLYDFLRFSMLPLVEIDKHLPQQGKIIDLGCGEGIIAKYLAKNSKRTVMGIDNDQSRLTKSELTNLKFINSDIRSYKFNNIDGIIISDVLHHLSYQDQRKILSKISKHLDRKGTLVIKEIDTGEFLRSRLSRFWDFVFYPKDKIYYWNSQNLENYLAKLGFKVEISRPVRFFPGSTTLFICKKS